MYLQMLHNLWVLLWLDSLRPQRAALGQSQGLVKSLPESSTGWLATAAVQPGKEKFARGTVEKK